MVKKVTIKENVKGEVISKYQLTSRLEVYSREEQKSYKVYLLRNEQLKKLKIGDTYIFVCTKINDKLYLQNIIKD
jgi:hypothetical protein